tara:strand:+ start:3151 stop:6243 length:3093 start_codon:yes stop_codon:yes gene_type:complete
VDLNKKSVKQQGGAMIPQQPGMQQQPQVDPQVMQITEVFSQSMGQGKEPQEIVMGLMEQQVDQNLIGQALMTMGYEQEMVVQLFKQIAESQRPQSPSPQEITNNPQQLARAEEMQKEAPAMNMNIDPIDMAKSGIEIKPENKGKFTAWAKSRGMSVKEAANKVMANPKKYPPSVVKMANFAKNAAGFKKQLGGTSIQNDTNDIESQIALLQQQAAIAKAQAEHAAKMRLLEDPSMYRTISPERQREIDSIGIADGMDPSMSRTITPERKIEMEEIGKLDSLNESMYRTLTPQKQFEQDYINYTEKNGPISVQDYSKLTGMDASMYRTITPERQLEDDIIKKQGGEFKPHFMYKGERKIRAKDMATHLRLKKAGYNHKAPKAQTGGEGMYDTPMSDRTPGAYAPKMYTGGNVPIGFNPDPNVQAELEKKFGDNPMANQLNDFLKLTGNGKQNKLIDQKDNGYVAPNPMYFNPAMFGDMDVNVADIINTTASVGNDLFGQEGSISKFGKNRTEDKLRKLSNSTYDVKADLSPENQEAFQDYVTQFKYENPEKDILGNLVEESEKIASEISTENIDLKDPQILKFLKMSTKNMSKKGQELYDQLKLKFFPDGAPDAEVEETEEVTEEGTTNVKYGGSPFLPKAQFNIPDNLFGSQEGDFDMTGGGFNPATFDLEDFMKRAQQTNYMEDTELVDRAAIDAGTYGNRTQNPTQSSAPLDAEYDRDGDGIPDMIDIDGGNGTGEGFPGTAGSPSADELRSRINKPTVKRNRNPLAAAENMFNTAGAQLFGDISNGIYQGTRIANDIGDAKRARQSEYDLKTVDTIADNTYGVMTDMNFKRGKGELVNPGGFGSEGDRTTGLYMDTAKEGGGVNNAGFKALPPAVQQKILKSLQVGGGTGGTAAIDTAAILKGLPYDFMSTSMGKQLLNVEPDTATDIMNVYSKAQNISSLSDGLDFFTSVSKKDIGNVMKESGIDKYTVRDYVKNQDFYNDASWATQQAIKLAMKTKGLKQGGETVNVDSRMLAKLIAAGADIEKL